MANPAITGGAQFAAADNGTLLYLPGPSLRAPEVPAPIVWMDRQGKTTPLRATPVNWANPQFAPDGRQLAMYIKEGTRSDVWIYDWARDTLSRLTLDAASNSFPVWTPDGRRIAFASTRADKSMLNLYWQRADGTGEVQRLTESKNSQVPVSWHPSGKVLAFEESNPQQSNMMILPMEGDEASGWKPGKPTVLLKGPFRESWATFSPDGRWLAYTSDESGRSEVYVRPFPGPGGKLQISTSGGALPRWSRTRRELLYETVAAPLQIMVASYSIEGDSFQAAKSRLWADRHLMGRPAGWDFDLHPDGERIALAPEMETRTPVTTAKQDKLVFIFNFFDELRRIAPVAKR
jgi:Tol biopolymer transport system component